MTLRRTALAASRAFRSSWGRALQVAPCPASALRLAGTSLFRTFTIKQQQMRAGSCSYTHISFFPPMLTPLLQLSAGAAVTFPGGAGPKDDNTLFQVYERDSCRDSLIVGCMKALLLVSSGVSSALCAEHNRQQH